MQCLMVVIDIEPRNGKIKLRLGPREVVAEAVLSGRRGCA